MEETDREKGECAKNIKRQKQITCLLQMCIWCPCVCIYTQAGGRELPPQANNMEFEILAGLVIEHGSLITELPGWPVITMTYHWAEEHGVYNKIH